MIVMLLSADVYLVIINNRLCFWPVIMLFVGSFLYAFIHEIFLLKLNFCNSSIIHHFYCDIMPLLKISYSLYWSLF
jgi:olfactory receptor